MEEEEGYEENRGGKEERWRREEIVQLRRGGGRGEDGPEAGQIGFETKFKYDQIKVVVCRCAQLLMYKDKFYTGIKQVLIRDSAGITTYLWGRRSRRRSVQRGGQAGGHGGGGEEDCPDWMVPETDLTLVFLTICHPRILKPIFKGRVLLKKRVSPSSGERGSTHKHPVLTVRLTPDQVLSSNSGTQWHTVAHSGTQWHTVAHSGTQWHTVVHSGTQWHTVAHSGT